MALLRVEMTDALFDIRHRSRRENPPCRFWIKGLPNRQHAQSKNNRPHPFAVLPEYLSKAFQKTRDEVGIYSHLESRERPSLHEIRSLGSRIYRELGYPKSYVQALLSHTDEKVTDIYLENPALVKDEHFRPVKAELSLAMTTDLDV